MTKAKAASLAKLDEEAVEISLPAHSGMAVKQSTQMPAPFQKAERSLAFLSLGPRHVRGIFFFS